MVENVEKWRLDAAQYRQIFEETEYNTGFCVAFFLFLTFEVDFFFK